MRRTHLTVPSTLTWCSLEHGAAVASALPAGRLAVLPGTHLLPIESPDLVTAILLAFVRGWPADLI